MFLVPSFFFFFFFFEFPGSKKYYTVKVVFNVYEIEVHDSVKRITVLFIALGFTGSREVGYLLV